VIGTARTCLLAGALCACAPANPVAGPPQSRLTLPVPLGLDIVAPVPDDNPVTSARVALGLELFFDPILSADSTISCSSCHQPQRYFTTGRRVSVGVYGRVGRRNVPTLVNVAYSHAFFWDGRVAELEEQVLRPIQDPLEMDLELDELAMRLSARPDYRQAFRSAFPDGRIERANIARALASYLRTIRSGNSRFDRYLAGDTSALWPQARRGLRLFFRRAGCGGCHVGPLLTDQRFHNTGVSWGSPDRGRYEVTGREEDRGAFKPPTLRNVAHTAPYMHDGSIATLEEVIEFYDRGGTPNPRQDFRIRPLGLTDDEKSDLLAFLRSLTGSRP
jgi:cytochrome c peroxidase